MKPNLLIAAGLALGLCAVSRAQDGAANSPGQLNFFELRTYYAAPGKLDALNSRFRDHTLKIFEKHGMKNIGYWEPVDNTENKLVYMLAYPNREAREKSWKEFFADPEWQSAQKQSEANGKLVAKVDSIFLKLTDYSPQPKVTSAAEPRLFELRTYTAAPGKLDALNTRFREKTLSLFDRHGISSIAYWTPVDKNKGADDTLIYIVAHPSKAAADRDWKAFREDAEWVAAKRASEVQGPLTATDGVKSVYMKPTDYSPLK